MKLVRSFLNVLLIGIVAASPARVHGENVSWTSHGSRDQFTVSRASYQGRIDGTQSQWSGEIGVEVIGKDPVEVPILPRQMVLRELLLDGKPAPILARGENFATSISEAGTHTLQVKFSAPSVDEDGAPRLSLSIAETPISRFEITLPGNKEVRVSPVSSIETKFVSGNTLATIFVPMSKNVQISWSDALPVTELGARAQAQISHLVRAADGILNTRAIAAFDLTRGEISTVEFEIPEGVDVSQVSASTGKIVDWRVGRGDGKGPRILSLSLATPIREHGEISVSYDLPLASARSLSVPILFARNVTRQRGMIALLTTKELSLKPGEEKAMISVGENQLPAAIREPIKETIAHTFKYIEERPSLMVQPAAPERREGRFETVANTLLSLGDVAIRGSTNLSFDVKTGSISQATVLLPKGVLLISLSAPSLRKYDSVAEENGQKVDIQFTQDMEGQFSVDLVYERLLKETEQEPSLPLIHVGGAEVEQGRIAVEALSAVEVQPTLVRELSQLELSEVPQQILVKATNPLLLAYKYVRFDPGSALTLKLTRHKEVETQTAIVDFASYKTLVTSEGLSVTTAQFLMRNTKNQFLRLTVPKDAAVWSAAVNGNPEKPALGSDDDKGDSRELLIKVINSATQFPVEITYASRISELGSFGTIRAVLPTPDVVTTRANWELFLPEEFSYGRLRTDMKITDESFAAPLARDFASKMMQANPGGLAVVVPETGVRYAMEQLYIDQKSGVREIAIPYFGAGASWITYVLIAAASLALWIIAFSSLGLGIKEAMPFRVPVGLGATLVLLILRLYLGVTLLPALLVSIVAIAGAGFTLYRSYASERSEATSGALI